LPLLALSFVSQTSTVDNAQQIIQNSEVKNIQSKIKSSVILSNCLSTCTEKVKTAVHQFSTISVKVCLQFALYTTYSNFIRLALCFIDISFSALPGSSRA